MTQVLSATTGKPHARIIPYKAPSVCISSLCKKVSETLVAAQYKTSTQRGELLPFLKQFRDAYIEDFKAQEINLLTLNGTTINGLHFPGTQKKALIYLQGNGYFYETAAGRPLRWREGLKRLSVEGIDQYPHLVVCNPGGTGKSEGNTHPFTVARDLLAQFEYLVYQHGIDPNDIAIVGFSMGGYLGSFGAELIQVAFPEAEINFLSQQSFASIYSRVHSERLPVMRQIFGSAISVSIYLTSWAQDSIAALETLKGRVCIVYNRLDGVIPYVDSTHHALVHSQRTRTYSCLALQEEDLHQEPSAHAHNRDLTEEENGKIVVELKKMLHIPLTAAEELLTLENL
jgi:hypothetical protein